MNISAPFIRRPVATSLIMSALALLGITAFPYLPVAPLPQVDFPTVQVTATLAGGSAETMASSVAAPLERQFGQIPGVTQMTSLSSLGVSQIVIQFDLDRNIDLASQDVQAAITAASKFLPQAMTQPPNYKKVNPADVPIIMLWAHSETLPLTTVHDYLDNFFIQALSQLPGVAQASIIGDQKPSIRIQVDPAKLAAIGLTLEEVRTKIVNATSNAAKGTIYTAKVGYSDRRQRPDSPKPQPYEDVILAYRDNAALRVRDVGHAVLEPTSRYVAGFPNNKPGILLAVRKLPGANVIDTVELIKAQLPKLTANIPAAMKVDTLLDRTTTIRASVHDVEFTLVLTIFLVVAVVLVFLRSFWATFVPSITVVLALLGSFAAMYALQLQPRQHFADGAHDRRRVRGRRRHRGGGEHLPPHRGGHGAVRGGAEGIGRDRLHGGVDQRFAGRGVHSAPPHGRDHRARVSRIRAHRDGLDRDLGLRLAHARADAVRALHEGAQRRSTAGSTVASRRASMACSPSTGAPSRSRCATRRLTLGVFFATMALTVALAISRARRASSRSRTPALISGVSEASQEVSPQEMMRLQQELGAIILRDPDVQAMGSQTGSTDSPNPANTGGFTIVLKPREERTATARQIIDRLRPQFAQVPGANVFLQPTQDINVGARLGRGSYQYTLQDPNVDELIEWSQKMLEKMRDAAAARRRVERSSRQCAADAGSPSIATRPSRFGISPQLIDDTLNDAYGQRQITQYYTQLNTYFVILEILPELQADPRFARSALREIAAHRRRRSALRSRRDGREPAGPLSVTHQSQFPAVTLTFNLRPGVALGQAVDAINQAAADLGMPGADHRLVRRATRRRSRTRSRARRRWCCAALVVVYIILGILYESFVHPLTILSTLPSAGVGALLALRYGGMDLGVIGIVGIILLIGIVKKNGIMLVDFAIAAERDRGIGAARGRSAKRACCGSGRS